MGKAWETEDSVGLTWSYKDRPGSNLYEIIDRVGTEKKPCIRVWKWSFNDDFEGLTMIDERKVGEESDIDPPFVAEIAEAGGPTAYVRAKIAAGTVDELK